MTDGVLLDVSGVLYEGSRTLPGAARAVMRLRAEALPVRFVTNTTRRSKQAIGGALANHGIPADPGEIFTPVAAVCAWLAENGLTPHLLVHPDLETEFDECARNGPPAVVIGDAASRFTYETLNAAFRLLADGAPLLALAANRVFLDDDGKLSLDAGPFVRALEYASGSDARLFGKPAPEFFHTAVASMGLDPKAVAMVGDDAESDVSGALAAGLGTGILVRTGKYRTGDEDGVSPPPSAVVEDIGAAVARLLDRG